MTDTDRSLKRSHRPPRKPRIETGSISPFKFVRFKPLTVAELQAPKKRRREERTFASVLALTVAALGLYLWYVTHESKPPGWTYSLWLLILALVIPVLLPDREPR